MEMITSKIILQGLKSEEQELISLSVNRKVSEAEAEECRILYGAERYEILEFKEDDEQEVLPKASDSTAHA